MAEGRNLYLLIAREAIPDPQDNMNSIIKIIEKFTSVINEDELTRSNLEAGKNHITIPVTYAIASSWLLQKLPKDTAIKITIKSIDPNGKKLDGPEQEQVVPKGIDKVNLNFNVQGLPITTEGKYILHATLSANSRKLAEAEYPYEVELKWQAKKAVG